LRVYELGSPDDASASAPVLAGDSVIVAFLHVGATKGGFRAELRTQRLDPQGKLGEPRMIRADVAAARPKIAAVAGKIQLVAPGNKRTDLIELDGSSGGAQTDAPPIALPFWPGELTAGPRGLVAMYATQENLLIQRNIGGADAAEVLLPRAGWVPELQELTLASGVQVDLALSSTSESVWLTTLRPGDTAPVRQRELFPGLEKQRSQVGIAAGPAGFAVVRNGLKTNGLWLLRLDAQGETVGEPGLVPGFTPETRQFYPHVTALGEGWVVSYWDGNGPTIQRFDAAGRAIGQPQEVRSGDERHGHTDARMAANDHLLALTWQVQESEFSHGFPDEHPRRPGPRLGVLRCRDQAP
jgi:hypothetical protein